MTDAQTLFLGKEPTQGVYGSICDITYEGSGGDTLYKTTDGGVELVKMYSGASDKVTGEFIESMEVKIDRHVRSIQDMDDNYVLVQFFGKESDADSYQCLKNGHSYDPNCALTYIVSMENGQMFNVTYLTRCIDLIDDLTMTVFDRFLYFEYASCEDGKYMFLSEYYSERGEWRSVYDGTLTHNNTRYTIDRTFLVMSFSYDDDGVGSISMSLVPGEQTLITGTDVYKYTYDFTQITPIE